MCRIKILSQLEGQYPPAWIKPSTFIPGRGFRHYENKQVLWPLSARLPRRHEGGVLGDRMAG